jgi:hypothetical protein
VVGLCGSYFLYLLLALYSLPGQVRTRHGILNPIRSVIILQELLQVSVFIDLVQYRNRSVAFLRDYFRVLK